MTISPLMLYSWRGGKRCQSEMGQKSEHVRVIDTNCSIKSSATAVLITRAAACSPVVSRGCGLVHYILLSSPPCEHLLLRQ